ncbi:galactose-specific lectin nattectin-like [Pempheris klunzingeri]|uniref:galactose-specific lectin nattectin-like n=1 Tax=Pempheris klunzingeri TaxID=3127111 RepID=UPI00398168EB
MHKGHLDLEIKEIFAIRSHGIRSSVRCAPLFVWTVDWSRCNITRLRFCNHLGGNLASLHTIDEYNFIRGVILRVTGYHKSTWVGGHDAVREGVWLWSDGSLFDFTGWAYREPNNYKGREDCMEINFAGRDYVNDNRCYRRKSFVCIKRL